MHVGFSAALVPAKQMGNGMSTEIPQAFAWGFLAALAFSVKRRLTLFTQ
jgi:hypothetical protein